MLRWEYSPGSTVYVVWSQVRSDYHREAEDLSFGDGVDRLFSTHPDNIVLVKVSKWFSP